MQVDRWKLKGIFVENRHACKSGGDEKRNAIINPSTTANKAPFTPNPKKTRNTPVINFEEKLMILFNPNEPNFSSPCNNPRLTGSIDEKIKMLPSMIIGMMVFIFKNIAI